MWQACSLSWREIAPHPSRLLTANKTLRNGPGKRLSGSYVLHIAVVLNWMVPPPKIFLCSSPPNLWLLPYFDRRSLKIALWRQLVETWTLKLLLKWGDEEFVIRNWRNRVPYYVVAEILAQLCPTLVGKVEISSKEIKCLAEEISKQNVEGAACPFPCWME